MGMYRVLRSALFVLAHLCLLFWVGAATALEVVTIPEKIGAVDLTAAVELREGQEGRVQLSTAPDVNGIIRRIEVQATNASANPDWALIAIHNPLDVQVERLLVAPFFQLPGSGVFRTDLGGKRINVITASQGFRPQRVADQEADVFSITVDPGATVTYVIELEGEKLPELVLWEPSSYRDYVNAFTLFRGTVLGVSGLLAVFLSIMFVVKGRGVFPAAAALAWAVMFYLLVDFGILAKLINIQPTQLQTYRAAAEAALATTLFGFLFIYLNLHRWHIRFIHLALALMLVMLALIILAFFQPVLAVGTARAVLALLGVFGIVVVGFLALRGYDRAVLIVPTWIIFVAWLVFGYMVVSGDITNDIAQSAVAGGLVLIVMLLGFTAIQHAFTEGQVSIGALSEVERRALALTGSGDFVFDWNIERDRVVVSDGLAARLGEDPNALRGDIKLWLERLHPEDRDRFRTALDTLVELRRGRVASDFRIITHDGSYRNFRLRVKPVLGGNDEVSRCVGTLQDVTDERVARDRLLHDAVHDSLTGLPNIELYLDRLDRALTRSRESRATKPAVFLIDLDGFTNLDERIGHVAADSVLLAIARRLSRLMRPLDTLARINGDQFAVILVSEDSAAKIAGFAEQLRRAIREPIKFGDNELSVSASMGITIYDNKPITAQQVLRNAELAMLHAKRDGGDRIEAFRTTTSDTAAARNPLDVDLKTAIDNREVQILFQPIFDLSNGQLAGAEALMRWHHPQRGAISPSEFIPLAERAGLIEKLGRVVIEQTSSQLKNWLSGGEMDKNFFLSINLSAQQLSSETMLNDMRSLVSTNPKIAQRFLLEVTESQVMTSPEHSAYVLDSLKSLGFRLALDDFGVGHSSLSYLHRFPFDFIKIPSTFVQLDERHGIAQTQMPIMKSIMSLSHDLDLKVIAEGAESDEEVARIQGLGCHYAQGFAFSKAISGGEFEQLLAKDAKSRKQAARDAEQRARKAEKQAQAKKLAAAERQRKKELADKRAAEKRAIAEKASKVAQPDRVPEPDKPASPTKKSEE
ncbi:EAL domain-containing protein [Maritalea mediterranea]|uniref:EAL domain-containing protein n=1 Tax=Maritalea mediterranea TaxID=2909667 RepID=A0ABS9E4L5_9HYPH|nr:EAL domain-containing protein [Maritalea mediterranea]MCF4097805.1 EAL domain-containing protein [Maritalea mediterranea]